MVDAIPPILTASGTFDTAAMQIAMAKAQAAANHVNEAVFLSEIAKSNDIANAKALDGTVQPLPTDNLFTNSLLNVDPAADPALDPTIDPSSFSIYLASKDFTNLTTSDSIKAQQLHDFGVLQKDAESLEKAAATDNHIPLGHSASTVDLSIEAQNIISEIATFSPNNIVPTQAQLAQIAGVVQPVTDEPLTATLLDHIQAQLNAAQNPIRLSLNTLAVAMNYIAAMQPATNHMVDNAPELVDKPAEVAPVRKTYEVAVEDVYSHS